MVEDAAAYLKTIRQDLVETDRQRGALNDFTADFFGPLLKKFGWDKKNRETQEATLTRPTVLNALACETVSKYNGNRPARGCR